MQKINKNGFIGRSIAKSLFYEATAKANGPPTIWEAW